MKHIKIIGIVLSIITFVSCSESFLDSELVTKKTEENFYKDKNDASLALIGCYDGLQKVWSDGVAFPVASEILSDNCFGGAGLQDPYGYAMLDEFNKDISPSQNSIYEPNWRDYYRAIYRCNMLLNKMDQIDFGIDTVSRKKFESEARFIRAFCYFDMVRLWGNIPLVTESTKENVPQADPDDVYKLITTDLKYACDSLSGKTYETQNESEFGRVTKWAAEALLARVYLYYTGYYEKADLVGIVTKSEALAYAEDVITSGGYELLENFSELWPAASLNNFAGERNSEIVFSIRYTYTSDWDGNTDSNHWLVGLGIRKKSIYPYGLGWGACTVNKKLWDAFAANDTRKTSSILSIDDEKLNYDAAKEDNREYTKFFVKKYTPMCDEAGTSLAEKLGGKSFMISQYQDFVSIRYSDVLLMAAELGSANAQSYFNLVRKRAYGTNFIEVAVSGSAIMEERRLEFAFEGIRYWDLLRQGMAVASASINEPGVELLNTIDGNPKKITFNVASKGLQQIPWNQITLSNNKLIQNEGW